jgi:hypothetical protein
MDGFDVVVLIVDLLERVELSVCLPFSHNKKQDRPNIKNTNKNMYVTVCPCINFFIAFNKYLILPRLYPLYSLRYMFQTV